MVEKKEDSISIADKQFQERIFYSNLLVQRIGQVLRALDFGKSGIDQLEVLHSILIPEVRIAIAPRVSELRKWVNDRLNSLYSPNSPKPPKLFHYRGFKIELTNQKVKKPDWVFGSDQHTITRFDDQFRDPINQGEMLSRRAVLAEVTLIIDELHKKKLLLLGERPVETGAFFNLEDMPP